MKQLKDIIYEIIESVKPKFREKFPDSNFNDVIKRYMNMPEFKINENIYEKGIDIDDEVHYLMRLIVTELLKITFLSMKVDLTDENVSDENGTLGTPGRIAKMWLGKTLDDTKELLSGRWNKPPKMASFPNTSKRHSPIFVKTSIDAVCSHHFIRFGDENYDNDSYVVIGYIPREKVGGISKINRFVEWCARRGWLQEDLTEYIGKKIEEYFETDSVYVKLSNLKHGCTSVRGACDRNASTTTVYKSGEFLTNLELIPPEYR